MCRLAGLVEQQSKFGGLIKEGLAGATGLTLGLVAHPTKEEKEENEESEETTSTRHPYAGRTNHSQAMAVMTIAHLPGTFLLELVLNDRHHLDHTGHSEAPPALWRPRWTVWTKSGAWDGLLTAEHRESASARIGQC